MGLGLGLGLGVGVGVGPNPNPNPNPNISKILKIIYLLYNIEFLNIINFRLFYILFNFDTEIYLSSKSLVYFYFKEFITFLSNFKEMINDLSFFIISKVVFIRMKSFYL